MKLHENCSIIQEMFKEFERIDDAIDASLTTMKNSMSVA